MCGLYHYHRYGDIFPVTDCGKVFTIFFALIAVSFCMKAFGEVTKFPILVKARLNELKITTQFGEQISENTLRSLLSNDFLSVSDKLKRNMPSCRVATHKAPSGAFLMSKTYLL